jgi:hypothetical protein
VIKCIESKGDCEYTQSVIINGKAVGTKSLEDLSVRSGGSSAVAAKRKATSASVKTEVKAKLGVSVLIKENANSSTSVGESNDLESIFVMIV